MGDFGVVADVSTIIVDRLTEALRGLDPNEPPTAVLSDLEDRPSRATLTVFLYEIAEDPTSRNRPPVRSLPPSAPTSRKPPGELRASPRWRRHGTALLPLGGPRTASQPGVTRASRKRPRPASRPEHQAEPELRELVRAEVAAVLGHPDAAVIADDRPFPELGFDSLTVIELRTRLAELSGTDLPATVIFDRPTVAELARYLGDRPQG